MIPKELVHIMKKIKRNEILIIAFIIADMLKDGCIEPR